MSYPAWYYLPIPQKGTFAFIWLNLTSPQQVLFSEMEGVPGLIQEGAHLKWPEMLRQQRGSAVTTSRNKKHEQGTSAPGPSHSQVVWGTRTRTHSKVRPLNSYHEFMSVWDREVEQEVREGIAEGKGCPGTATGSLHGRTSMDFQILPWFSHPPPELPPWETGPTSSMFVMIKCANVCRHVRTPCHVKYSMKGSYCCGWKKGAQNWKHAGCGEVCSQDKTAEREGY